ncbi:type II toxin-antitoxin system HicB family antitoxin [Dolichospermum sp. ST_sed3]|nr:type II toxin-antitoxin system HicB family antitoxin [Dolichospermum sp. ST_sed3]
MHAKLTAVFRKSPYGYVGYVEELPGANTQGKTLEETKKNLIEAVQLIIVYCIRNTFTYRHSGLDPESSFYAPGFPFSRE